MNWSRGMLRLWTAFTVLWLLGAAAFFWDAGLMPPGSKSINVEASELIVTNVQGELWNSTRDGVTIEIEVPSEVSVGSNEWSKMLDAVALEFSRRNAEDNAAARLRHVQTRNAFLVTASLPLVLLSLGFVAGWIVRGFRQV